MPVNYPENIINKSKGFTESESYLSKLCEKAFLSLWSYPNIFRDQGVNSLSQGKELCDLLVIFENHIIIFSDKNCEYPQHENEQISWSRWYNKAIKKSADQIYGAERWLLKYPERIYVDKECTKKFPYYIPSPDKAIIHRIAVTHGSEKQCSTKREDKLSSFKIDTSITDDMHNYSPKKSCNPLY